MHRLSRFVACVSLVLVVGCTTRFQTAHVAGSEKSVDRITVYVFGKPGTRGKVKVHLSDPYTIDHALQAVGGVRKSMSWVLVASAEWKWTDVRRRDWESFTLNEGDTINLPRQF